MCVLREFASTASIPHGQGSKVERLPLMLQLKLRKSGEFKQHSGTMATRL